MSADQSRPPAPPEQEVDTPDDQWGWQHSVVPSVRCTGITAWNAQCGMLAKRGTKYCYWHSRSPAPDQWDSADGQTHSFGDGCQPPHIIRPAPPSADSAVLTGYWAKEYARLQADLNLAMQQRDQYLTELQKTSAVVEAARAILVDGLREYAEDLDAGQLNRAVNKALAAFDSSAPPAPLGP